MMTPNLINALVITGVGMGLVFAAILLLWVVMAVLVRLTADRQEENQGEERSQEIPPVGGSTLDGGGSPGGSGQAILRRRAAAAAVAAAMATNADITQPHPFPLPAAGTVSAWQAVNRTRMLNKRGRTR